MQGCLVLFQIIFLTFIICNCGLFQRNSSVSEVFPDRDKCNWGNQDFPWPQWNKVSVTSVGPKLSSWQRVLDVSAASSWHQMQKSLGLTQMFSNLFNCSSLSLSPCQPSVGSSCGVRKSPKMFTNHSLHPVISGGGWKGGGTIPWRRNCRKLRWRCEIHVCSIGRVKWQTRANEHGSKTLCLPSLSPFCVFKYQADLVYPHSGEDSLLSGRLSADRV